MKSVYRAALVAAACAAGLLELSAAETARFRHVVSLYADAKEAGFKRPEGVACGDTGRVVIADTGNSRLVSFEFTSGAPAGWREIRVPQLVSPTRVQIGATGEIYALDGTQRRIVRFGPEGEFRGALTPDGVPPPATIVVKSFKVDASGTVYVLDVFSARVLVLDSSGKFMRAMALPAAAAFVTDVAVDSAGRILALDSIGRRLYAAAEDAEAFTPLGGDLRDALITLPTDLAVSRGLVFVSESGGAIASLGQDGTFLARHLTQGWQEGALNHPAQACVTDADEMFVADRDNSRVQVFALTR